MKFSEIVERASALLQRKGRVSYRALKREFQLDDEVLADVKEELLFSDPQIEESDGRGLVWTGKTIARGNPIALQSSGAKPSVPNDATPYNTDLDPKRADSHPTDGERRQLTVMFCDLVDSTALSGRLDPEDLRNVVRAYQDAAAAVINRYEGRVAQYLGDGLLVYFGYPTAHEDDAARAVRAGLDIVDSLSELNAQSLQAIQVRIGIHTGPVVVGEMGERHEQLAVGATPNIAARVQGQADPDTMLISAATYRLVEGLFECHDLGPRRLKGISTTISLYRVSHASAAQGRFDVAVRSGLTPLVGREEEIEQLHARWRQAQAGHGQVVLLSGEAGMGKSRILQEFKERVGEDRAIGIELHCSSYHRNSALYPVIEHAEHLFQFDREDSAQTKQDKLRTKLGRYRFPQADTVPLVAALLSLPQPTDGTALHLSPQKQKQKTNDALVAWILEETDRSAVLVVCEDLHWIDPSSLELITLLHEQVRTARMLLVLTFRPEFVIPWPAHPYITSMELARLPPHHMAQMMAQVVAGKTLPPDVTQQLLSKADGVPLFVEELTKDVMESELLQETDGHYELKGSLQTLAIPSTLQDSLAARLDRLETSREVAQLGAVLGREFSYELLQAVSGWDEKTLRIGLQRLVEAELVFRRGVPPEVTYVFKHALVQDSAYESLLKSDRQHYHQQAAQVMEEHFPELRTTQPELLAHHYTQANLAELAIPAWQQAGERATQRSANTEAIGHFTTALDLLRTLPDTVEHAHQEMALLIALGVPLMATKGYGAAEVAQTYERARTFSRQLGQTTELLPVLSGLCRFYYVRADIVAAQELGEECLRLAGLGKDSDSLLEAHRLLGASLVARGAFKLAREHLEDGIALYNAERSTVLTPKYGTDPGVVCRCHLSYVLWCRGYPDQACAISEQAVTLGRAVAHPLSLAGALFFASTVRLFCRDVAAAEEYAREAVELSIEYGLPFFIALGNINLGWVLVAQKQSEMGISQMDQNINTLRSAGAKIWRPSHLALLADAYGQTKQCTKGQVVLTEALHEMENSKEYWWEAELHRLNGALILQGSRAQKEDNEIKTAEASLHKSLTVAREQGAKSWELRTAMSLARHWQQRDKRGEARELLAPVYDWFSEGFNSKDLQDAQALLEELG